MKKLFALCLALVFVLCLGGLAFGEDLASVGFCPPPVPYTPPVVLLSGNANANGFANATVEMDQGISDQQITQFSIDKNNYKNCTIESSGYAAYHNGPCDSGKGFYNDKFTKSEDYGCTTTIQNVKAQTQGMVQNTKVAVDGAAGICTENAGYGNIAVASAVNGSQVQNRTYNLNGTTGSGTQTTNFSGSVNINLASGPTVIKP
jgi:hypothetical protein